jgi:hypothetical protein
VKFHRIVPQLWELGIMEATSPQGGKIWLYDKERCICDLIRDKKNTDPQVFIQGLKEYFTSKDRDSIRLMEYARRFGIEEKIQDYLEILT